MQLSDLWPRGRALSDLRSLEVEPVREQRGSRRLMFVVAIFVPVIMFFVLPLIFYRLPMLLNLQYGLTTTVTAPYVLRAVLVCLVWFGVAIGIVMWPVPPCDGASRLDAGDAVDCTGGFLTRGRCPVTRARADPVSVKSRGTRQSVGLRACRWGDSGSLPAGQSPSPRRVRDHRGAGVRFDAVRSGGDARDSAGAGEGRPGGGGRDRHFVRPWGRERVVAPSTAGAACWSSRSWWSHCRSRTRCVRISTAATRS